jgi:hypothetical protein
MTASYLSRGEGDHPLEPPRHEFLPRSAAPRGGADAPALPHAAPSLPAHATRQPARRAAPPAPEPVFEEQEAPFPETRAEARAESRGFRPAASLPAARLPGGRPSQGGAPLAHTNDDGLGEAVQVAIRRLERGRDADPSAGLLELVETTAAVLEQQAAELRAARAANARLATENERLRAMIKALLAAVDAGDRRLSEAVELAERRLRELAPRAGG